MRWILLSILFFQFPLFSQKQEIDPLDSIFNLAVEAAGKDSNVFAESLRQIQFSESCNGKAKYTELLAYKYFEENKSDSAYQLIENSFQEYILCGDTADAYDLKYRAGKRAASLEDFEYALRSYVTAEQYFELKDSTQILADIYLSTGNVYRLQGDYPSAFREYLQSETEALKLSDTSKLLKVFVNYAIIYQRTKEYDVAKNYLDQCLDLYKSLKDTSGIITTSINTGNYYIRTDQIDSSILVFSTAVELSNIIQDFKLLGKSYQGLGNAYLLSGNYPKSKEYFKLSLKANEKAGNLYGIRLSRFNLAKIAYDEKNYKQANYYFKLNYELAKETQNLEELVESTSALYFTNKRLKDYKTSLAYFEEYQEYNDSIKAKSNQKKIKEVGLLQNFRAQTDSIRNSYNTLTREKNRIISAQNRLSFYLIISLILIITITILISLFYINEGKRKKVLQELNSDLNDRNQQIVQQTIELEKAKRQKDRFFANMSHEIRTPMHGIGGLAELLLKEKHKFDDDSKELIEHISISTKNITDLLTNLLDINKLENYHRELNISKVSLSEIHKGIQSTFSKVIENKGVVFNWQEGTNFPTHLFTDKDLIMHVLMNLIGNAFKFTKNGKIEINWTLLNSRDYQIEITDTGIGIPKKDQEFIFDLFSKSEITRYHEIRGSGLGLHIVKQSIELLQGTVNLNSEEGVGSKFTIVIPNLERIFLQQKTQETEIQNEKLPK